MDEALVAEAPGDAVLIASVRAGDPDAFGTLFERHADAARRLARQLSPSDADDLVAEAFTRMLSLLQDGKGPDEAFRAYLLTAIRRLHVDRIRSTTRTRPTDQEHELDRGVDFVDTASVAFENEAAATAFRSLPERWQLVLWHLEVEGQKPADVAPLLGMSANSVSALAYRAREGLRQAYLQSHLTTAPDDECRTVTTLLGGYVRQGLSARDARKVDGHLEDCRHCTGLYLELVEVNHDLRGLIAPVVLGGAAAGYVGSLGIAGAAVGGLTVGAAASGLSAVNLVSTGVSAGSVSAGTASALTSAGLSTGFAGTSVLATTTLSQVARVALVPAQAAAATAAAAGAPTVVAATVVTGALTTGAVVVGTGGGTPPPLTPPSATAPAPVPTTGVAPAPEPTTAAPEEVPAPDPTGGVLPDGLPLPVDPTVTLLPPSEDPTTPSPTPTETPPAPAPEPPTPTDFAIGSISSISLPRLLARRVTIPVVADGGGARPVARQVTVRLDLADPTRFIGVVDPAWTCDAAAEALVRTLSCSATLPAGQGGTLLVDVGGLLPRGTATVAAPEDPLPDNDAVAFRTRTYLLGL